ncbi:Elongation factor 1-beta 1 [Capsicum annuum]|nr:Elongation factor 1-beta 1 [Capsicum annuum]
MSGESFKYDGGIHSVLALSYYDLPYQYKPCFLYLDNFPEDQKILARRLYQLWAAEAFSNLHTKSGVKSVNDHLSRKTYVSGDQLTKDDIKVYGEILELPSSDIYPNTSKWYQAISAKLASSFPRKAVGVRFGSQAAPAIATPAKEAASLPMIMMMIT